MSSLTRRKKQKIIIAARNTELFVQTVYYKPNRYAFRNMIFLLAMLVAAFASMALMNTAGAIILVLLLIAVPVLLSFVTGNKWFSVNAAYDEPLIFEPDALQVSDEYFSIRDLEDVVFYIHSFYGFRYHTSRLPGFEGTGFDLAITGGNRSEYGDKNEFHFKALGKEYTCQFLLGSGRAWYAMYQIMEAWKMQGKAIVIKEEFPFDFVEQEIARFA
jgi:hypothetical protein